MLTSAWCSGVARATVLATGLQMPFQNQGRSRSPPRPACPGGKRRTEKNAKGRPDAQALLPRTSTLPGQTGARQADLLAASAFPSTSTSTACPRPTCCCRQLPARARPPSCRPSRPLRHLRRPGAVSVMVIVNANTLSAEVRARTAPRGFSASSRPGPGAVRSALSARELSELPGNATVCWTRWTDLGGCRKRQRAGITTQNALLTLLEGERYPLPDHVVEDGREVRPSWPRIRASTFHLCGAFEDSTTSDTLVVNRRDDSASRKSRK